MISSLVLALAVAAPTQTYTPYEHGYVDALRVTGVAVARDPNVWTEIDWTQRSTDELIARSRLPSNPLLWIVTATMTKTPTPNAEATCVASGHVWQDKSNFDVGLMNMSDTEAHRRKLRVVEGGLYEGDPHLVVRCRRCGLWREKT